MITLQPPSSLAQGFLDFANSIKDKVRLRGTKFTGEEMVYQIETDPFSKIRVDFLFWVIDLNKVLEGIGLIISDLKELKSNEHSFKGDPVLRSEFLFQVFFGEFYRLKEISKIYISNIAKTGILDNKSKKMFSGVYHELFDWIYNLRNIIIHQGVTVSDDTINLDSGFLNRLSKEERDRFITLLKESNTREGTLEIQCAIYIEAITEIIKQFEKAQNNVMDILAGLVIESEKRHH